MDPRARRFRPANRKCCCRSPHQSTNGCPPESRVAKPGGFFRSTSVSGRWAEKYVEWRLRLRGWRIESRNLRTPLGEIDLLARERAVLVIVEVKYRTTKARWPLEDRQARRLQRVALWLAANREISGGIRIDLVEVTPRCFPFLPALDHLEAAVESDFP
ncbi:MAG: YraN family protein [Planctomycetota bacterium]